MNRVVNRYLTQSILLIVALTLLTASFLWLRGSLGAMAAPLCIVVVFQLVACLTYGLVWQSVAASSTASLPTLYLTASGARMFAGVVVVLGFLFLSDDKVAIRFFVITFLIYYFIILIYDTAYFVKVEKTIQQTG